MSIEQRFDVSLIAAMALKEKQIQQNYRPIIGVHKWFARRPGTLFRGLMLAEFGEGRLEEIFFRSNDFPGLSIADPFMGGGTPLIEANRLGCNVQGVDVNPMSTWIVREEIEHLDLKAYARAANALMAALRDDIDRFYRTSCPQYGELMDFCYVWLRRLVGKEAEGFNRPFTRSPHELTGNVTEGRGLERFTEGLSKVYSRMVDALKPGAPLVFTYHHNRLEAYCAIGVAILDAGVVCSASLPCPAEMGGSIHIHGTTSSIIDTVFVCRKSGTTRRSWLFDTPDRLVEIVSQDLTDLAATGRRPSHGDTRCIVFGHLTRIAVWKLRESWKPSNSTKEKIASFVAVMKSCGDPDQLARRATTGESMEDLPLLAQKTNKIGEGPPDFISF